MLRKSAMGSGISIEKESSGSIWVISDRLPSDFDSKTLLKGVVADRVLEYKISDLAKYMLNPKPIEVTNRLIGCKIYLQKPAVTNIESNTKKYFNKLFKSNRSSVKADLHEETLLSDYLSTIPSVTDASFQWHVNRIKALLTPYDSLNERIAELDVTKLHDVLGVYDDPEGNHSLLQLNGTIPEKIDYILNNIHRQIGVLLKKAHMNKGLFEMRGFNFASYDPENSSRLIILTHNGVSEAYVLGQDGNVEFQLEEIELIKYLHFFQASLRTNNKLRNLLYKCAEGDIRPLKLFFNRELEIDYFKTDLPKIYKEVFDTNTISLNAKNMIVEALNKNQIGILMNYIYDTPEGKSCPSTDVYVMHDVQALETVKTILPYLYSQINQKLGDLAAKKYYLMDSMKV